MYKFEVLAPAGELEAVYPLIEAGANAIYVGLEGFSSRPMSADFSISEIKEAVDICHKENARLHVAINGCISEKYVNSIYDKLKELEELGVDAVIIADWGVLNNASKIIKNMELHASTLLGTYNAKTIEFLKEIGVKRTVLSTNLYIDEISKIINSVTDMEYEIVADGGICFNDNRICELPHINDGDDYTVFCRNKYMLSINDEIHPARRICAKQISSSEIVDLYLEMGIHSFKIEGRTVNYRYIIPRVKKIRDALDKASMNNHSIVSTLHYISERNRLEEIR